MDIYSTGALRRVVDDLSNKVSAFLLMAYFNMIQTDDREEIHFDVDSSKPRITPFVSPLVAGKIVQSAGHTTKTFRPAYAKDKRIHDPSRPLKRAIGEAIGGNLTPMERRAIALRRDLEDQLMMLTRREEVMASEFLRTGKVTVKGEGYPTVVVDFLRDAALTITLTSNDRWSVVHADSDPISDLEAWATLVQDKSGAVVREVTMDPKAWQLARARLIERDEMKYLFDYARSSESRIEAGPLAPHGNMGGRRVGRLGDFEIWTYQESYVDDDGETQKMLPDNTVVMAGPELLGTRCYGAIQDEKAGYKAERFFVKSWLEEDPANRLLLLQSAPLVAPYRPNASLCATVA